MPRQIQFDTILLEAFDTALYLPERDTYLAGVLEALAARLVRAKNARTLEDARLRLAEEGDRFLRRRRAEYWVPVRRAFWRWLTAWGMERRS